MYRWSLKELPKASPKTVFSCFAGGGGSSMGYKMAGFDVLGGCEIDPKMAELYKANLSPKIFIQDDIRSMLVADLPKELYGLDILDGSPPCSTFSMSGNREKDWGKARKFKEGQKEQVLDTLFFDFIALAKKLQPKVVVAENVKGILMGKAKDYVRRIYAEMDEAGYFCKHFLLNADTMGVPQSRSRVFFIGTRKDLSSQIMEGGSLFPTKHCLELSFNFAKIPFSEIREDREDGGVLSMHPSSLALWKETQAGNYFDKAFERATGKKGFFNNYKTHLDKPLRTISAHLGGGGNYDCIYPRRLTKTETVLGGSFPLDYDFGKINPKYVVGMSVPPLMVYRIAVEIENQLLKNMR